MIHPPADLASIAHLMPDQQLTQRHRHMVDAIWFGPETSGEPLRD